MRVYWLNATLHLGPESEDEREALRSLEACFWSLGHRRAEPQYDPPDSAPSRSPQPEPSAPTVALDDRLILRMIGKFSDITELLHLIARKLGVLFING
jgi:hypothetical protein